MSRGLIPRASFAARLARLVAAAAGAGGRDHPVGLVRLVPRLLALTGLAAALSGAGCASWPFPDRGPTRPKLVVLLVVDQLRPDRLGPGQPDGLGRLQREGRVFSGAALDYAFSETCPGHVTAVTGRFPSHAGIPGNRFVLEETLERVYCVLDPTPAGRMVAAAPPEQIPATPDAGRSPALLRSDAVGDWLKAAFPTARVHSLSGKDRSAVALGGRHPDGAWWVDVEGSGALSTSRYYLSGHRSDSLSGPSRPDVPSSLDGSPLADASPLADGGGAAGSGEALPGWAAAWTRERLLEGVPPQWIHPAHDPQGRIRDDDYFAEAPWASRTSPHPLNRSTPPGPPQASHDRLRQEVTTDRGEVTSFAGVMPRVAASPYLDRRLLEVALDLVDAEALGRDRGRGRTARAGADLLAIGLSSTDLVGHLYGPFSQESRAALADLDEAIGGFLAGLETRLGRDRVGVVLTADHGVLPLPEWAQAVDLPENGCPVEGGRVSEGELSARLLAGVNAAMVPPVPETARIEPWLVVDGLRLHANRARLEAEGVSRAQLDAAIRDVIAGEPAISRVWSREELEKPFELAFAGASREDEPPGVDDEPRPDRDPLRRAHRLLRHSLAPGRSPDWVLVPVRGCLITSRPHGTSHGSLHDYDRRIPLVFWGPGVEPGVDARPARLVDLAPTLARWLGFEPPEDVDGRALPLAAER